MIKKKEAEVIAAASLSTIVEPILKVRDGEHGDGEEDEGILLAIPASHNSNYKESGYQSTLTANTRANSNVGKKAGTTSKLQSKSIMLAGGSRAQEKIIMAGEQVVRAGDGAEASNASQMLISRNANVNSGVDKQLSNNSTVKIDLNS